MRNERFKRMSAPLSTLRITNVKSKRKTNPKSAKLKSLTQTEALPLNWSTWAAARKWERSLPFRLGLCGEMVLVHRGQSSYHVGTIEAVERYHRRRCGRDANAKRSGFQSNLSIGTLLSAPLPRSEACRAKGNNMRTLVQPPPSSHCDLCGGELRLKKIESANRTLELEDEILVCVTCGRERLYTVSHNHTMPNTKAAYPK